jgi:hypothetical protein
MVENTSTLQPSLAAVHIQTLTPVNAPDSSMKMCTPPYSQEKISRIIRARDQEQPWEGLQALEPKRVSQSDERQLIGSAATSGNVRSGAQSCQKRMHLRYDDLSMDSVLRRKENGVT